MNNEYAAERANFSVQDVALCPDMAVVMNGNGGVIDVQCLAL